ncbi:unnamed protein product [Trichobilharzia regenti]|nr:unnamed protein product [Trichobilharzia regenti]
MSQVPAEYAHLVSECREINKAKYNPLRFETSALHSTRIGITWDKTPAERTNWLRDQFRSDLSKYLVLSSSGASTAASSDPESEPPAPTVPRIRRHRPKKLPPAEVRLALLGLTSNNDDDRANVVDGNHELTENEEDGVDEEEEEEEVFDLAHNDDVSEAEDYDLRPVEKIPKETPSSSHKKVRRKVLPEAQDSEDAEEEEGSSDQGDGDDVNNDDINGTERGEKSRHQNKRKKKLKQRTKILEKKRKVQARIEREAKLVCYSLLDISNEYYFHLKSSLSFTLVDMNAAIYGDSDDSE